jgi:hypothetical protein
MRRLSFARPRIALAATALFAATVLFASAQSASGIGIGEAGFYSFGSSGCPSNDHTDPIGVVFEGTQASAKISAEQITEHVGWEHSVTSSSNQWLWVNTGEAKYGCRETNYQRASEDDVPPHTRFHVRLWYVPASNQENRRTVGTPHHEDFVELPQCPPLGGHAVDSNGPNGSGFDQGRHELKKGFVAAGHKVVSEEWGNSANFQQCDGDFAGSDGWGIRISLNHASG